MTVACKGSYPSVLSNQSHLRRTSVRPLEPRRCGPIVAVPPEIVGAVWSTEAAGHLGEQEVAS